MTNLYCSQGHQNPPDSKFCLHCGEKIVVNTVNNGIAIGKIIGDRYTIIKQIGQGGFGRTYLAEDINRFREICVLKEFYPQVQTPYVVQKAEELFQREASVLYKLQHPQIPKFRELLRTNLDHQEYLFLVQDYIAGETYNSLLKSRQQQGVKFTESEVKQLLLQLLPVLDYIHSVGVIHRDISPDNLILRNSDNLPILIDFGGVKQVAATVASQYYQSGITAPPSGTLLGKVGYAPPEQMQTGIVFPHSDLYALAVTILVLLTGKQPQELIDSYDFSWTWKKEITISDELGEILDKMLAIRASDRYQNANQILALLNPQPTHYPPTQPPNTVTTNAATSATAVVLPPPIPTPQPMVNTPDKSPNFWTSTNLFIVTCSLFISVGLISWGINNRYQGGKSNPEITSSSQPNTTSNSNINYSPEEKKRKQKLSDRREQLNIDYKFYVSLINQIFWDENPSLKGRTLSDKPEDESLRQKWDETAAKVLEKLSELSSESRKQMGTYTAAERDRWKVQVNNINVGSRSLYKLADTAFFKEFPEYKGQNTNQNFLKQPIGQVWQGFVNDKLNAILSNSAFQKVVFAEGATEKTVSGTLTSGRGKVFIAELAEGQNMTVKLAASSQILLSIYSPSGKLTLLEDSTNRSIDQVLPESGFYEFVVVSTGAKILDYQLTISAENPPEPEPTETPTEEPTPTETPTEEPTPIETPATP